MTALRPVFGSIAALALTGCFPDDWDGKPYVPFTTTPTFTDGPDDTGEPAGDPLVGEWVSEGADRSPLFASPPFEYASVAATFRSDGGFVVVPVDQEGVEYLVTGTWQAGGGDLRAIVLSQVEPYVATGEGILAIDGDVLTYEVVQTVPDYGFTPPTPATGFGATSGPGLQPGDNVQTFRRQ